MAMSPESGLWRPDTLHFAIGSTERRRGASLHQDLGKLFLRCAAVLIPGYQGFPAKHAVSSIVPGLDGEPPRRLVVVSDRPVQDNARYMLSVFSSDDTDAGVIEQLGATRQGTARYGNEGWALVGLADLDILRADITISRPDNELTREKAALFMLRAYDHMGL